MSWGDGSDKTPDPQPGDLWSTSKGRTVEILARREVEESGMWDDAKIDVVAYKFLGGSQIHLRAVGNLSYWTKVECQ